VLDQIIEYGFHLDLADKVPTPIHHIIEDHPQVQWELPPLDYDDVFPRSTAPAIAVPLTTWQPFLLPNGKRIPKSGYRIIADKNCGKGVAAYGLTQKKLEKTQGYFTTTGPLSTCRKPSQWQINRGIQLAKNCDAYPPDLPGGGLFDLGLYINNSDTDSDTNCIITTLRRCDTTNDEALLQCLSPLLTDTDGQRALAKDMLPSIREILPSRTIYYGEVKLLKDLPLTRSNATFLRWK
jgi:hypothetical protein